MKNNHFGTRLSAILVFAAFFFLAGGLQASSKMPPFSLLDVTDGKTVGSDEFRGKALLVTFFATWCPPCMDEVPSLIELQKEFAKEGFSVIALSVDEEGPGVVIKLIKKQEINYPVMMADNGTIKGFGGVFGIPMSFLVNRDGNVVKKYTGYVSYSDFAKDIRSVME
jgi:thiol-disulfide isomerase/thioredoxin